MIKEWQTFPQARQWCLLQVSVNSQVQIMHMVALRSGIQMGAFEPSGAPLSTTPSAWVERHWGLILTGWNNSQSSGRVILNRFTALPLLDFGLRWRLFSSWCSRLWPWRWPPATRLSLWPSCKHTVTTRRFLKGKQLITSKMWRV